MFIESSPPRTPGDKAILQSASFQPTVGNCFQFYYNMYGNGVGLLQVFVQQSGQNATKIWELSGNQGQQWTHGQINFQSNNAYQVRTSSLIQEQEIYWRYLYT